MSNNVCRRLEARVKELEAEMDAEHRRLADLTNIFYLLHSLHSLHMLHICNRRLADSTNILLILYTLHFVYVAYFAYFAYVAYLQSKVGGLNEDVAQVGKEDQGAPVPERGRPEAPGKFNLTCAVSPPMMITYLSRRTCKSWWTSCR